MMHRLKNIRLPRLLRILLPVAAAVLILLALTAYYRRTTSPEAWIQRVYALPTETSAAELERLGFLDLTDVQPQENATLHDLLFKAKMQASHTGVEKTFRQEDGELVIRLFWYTKSTATISMHTYHVNGAWVEGPTQTFLQEADCIENDGVVSVWLRAHTVDASLPDGEDYLLYQYKSGSE